MKKPQTWNERLAKVFKDGDEMEVMRIMLERQPTINVRAKYLASAACLVSRGEARLIDGGPEILVLGRAN